MIDPNTVSELFFELSNNMRLEILLSINVRALKMSTIAKKIGLSIHETSKHLTRLVDAKLAKSDSKDRYSTTPLGQQMAALLPRVNFLSTNASYFATHDPSCIPPHLQYGLGVIGEYETDNQLIEVFSKTANLLSKADDFIWIYSDQLLSKSLPLIDDALERGVEFRVILPKQLAEHGDHLVTYPQILEHQYTLAHDRFIETVEFILIMSEKKALIGFPTIEKETDYVGFSVANVEGLEWCKALFLHYWQKAKQW